MGIVVLGQLVAAGWLPHRRYTSLVRGNILFLSEDIYFIDKVSTMTMPKFTSQILLLFSKVLHILENLLLKNFTGLKVVS